MPLGGGRGTIIQPQPSPSTYYATTTAASSRTNPAECEDLLPLPPAPVE